MLSRFLALVAVLMLACASTDAHAYASPLQPENARQGFAAVDKNRTQEIAELSAERVKENSASAYDCTSRQTLGEQFDPNLGFYYLRARWMNPQVGRLATADEARGRGRVPGSQHRYLYASADPANKIDPSGYTTLADIGASLDIQGILSNIARDQISGYVQEKLFGGEDDSEQAPPSLYDILIGGLVRTVTGSLSSFAAAGPVAAATGGGRSEGHHTIPEYMCGAKSQFDLVDLPLSQHKKLHSELQAFDTAVTVGGKLYELMFRHRFKTETRAPIARLARTPYGRAAIVAGLAEFYEEFGTDGSDWWDLGRGQKTGMVLGGVFAVEGVRFVARNYNYPACKK